MPPLGFIKRCVKALACLAVLHHLLFASLSFGNAVLAGANPLEPIDRSSPRAALNSFLINANRSWETSISSTGEAQSSLLQDLATERARSCFGKYLAGQDTGRFKCRGLIPLKTARSCTRRLKLVGGGRGIHAVYPPP